MTGALVATAALMGLAGAAHCAGMCSAACCALGQRCVPNAPRRGIAALWLGRAVAYTLAGAGVGVLLQAVRWLVEGSAWLQPFWTMAQVMLVGLGLWLLVRGELPPTLQQFAERWGRPRPVQPVRLVRFPGEIKAAGAGLLWPLLPCGLLHAALALAALASTPWEAAGVMAAFAATSSAGLLAGGVLWRRIGRGGGVLAGGGMAIRMAGGGIALLSLWPLARHVWQPLETAWCG